MASADIIRAARARIADPKNWTECASARDAQGRAVSSINPKACSWCALGAVLSVSHGKGNAELVALETAVDQLFPDQVFIAGVNDNLGHAAVLQMYDAAIAAAEREAGQ